MTVESRKSVERHIQTAGAFLSALVLALVLFMSKMAFDMRVEMTGFHATQLSEMVALTKQVERLEGQVKLAGVDRYHAKQAYQDFAARDAMLAGMLKQLERLESTVSIRLDKLEGVDNLR